MPSEEEDDGDLEEPVKHLVRGVEGIGGRWGCALCVDSLIDGLMLAPSVPVTWDGRCWSCTASGRP